MVKRSESHRTVSVALPRRRVLQAGVAGSVALLAGCMDENGSPNLGEAYEIGESFESGGFEYVVTDAEVADSVTVSNTAFGGGEDGYGVEVHLEATNTGDEEADIPTTGSGLSESVDAPLLDDEEREFEVAHNLVSDWSVGPGLTSNMITVYEVPNDVSKLYVQLGSEAVQIYEA